MTNTLALLVAPGGNAVAVALGGVDFFYTPGAEDGQGGGGRVIPAKKRWVVERDGRLEVYDSAADALKATAPEAANDAPETAPNEAIEAPEAPAPAWSMDLAHLQALAQQYDETAAYQQAMQARHYEALLALFERLQDEDDVEILLAYA